MRRQPPAPAAQLAVLTGTALLVLSGAAGIAAADAPGRQGWWNLAHQGVQPPTPPDVPADGLLVQGGPNGPSAVAALRFDVPPGSGVTGLRLVVAGSAPQASGVRACPAAPVWKAAQNGPWADLPAYDCTTSVVGVLSGTELVFTGVGRLVSDAGVLSIAVVPGQTDRVSLAKPGAAALTVTAPAAASAPAPAATGPVAQPGPPAAPAAAPAAAPPPAPGVPVPASLALPPVPPAPLSSAAPVVVAPPAPPVAAALPAAAPRAFAGPARNDTRARVVVAVEGLLLLLTLGLVGAGPARRLGTLAGTAVPQAPERGVGRFARPRSGRAPRL